MKRGIKPKNSSISTSESPEDLKKSMEVLRVFASGISERYSISIEEVLKQLSQSEKKILISTFILRDKRLGVIESVVKYLKEDVGMSYHEIAELLDRDDRVIWTTYNKSIKKKKEKFTLGEPSVFLPVSIFTEKSGPLVAVSKYLVEKCGMDYASIARLLNRDSRSIWACYQKSRKIFERLKK